MRKAARRAEPVLHHPLFASIRVLEADSGSGSGQVQRQRTASDLVAVTVHGHGVGLRSRPPGASRSVARPSHRLLVGAARTLRSSTHVTSTEPASGEVPYSKSCSVLCPKDPVAVAEQWWCLRRLTARATTTGGAPRRPRSVTDPGDREPSPVSVTVPGPTLSLPLSLSQKLPLPQLLVFRCGSVRVRPRGRGPCPDSVAVPVPGAVCCRCRCPCP
jgi:hypothetical protein